MPACCAAMSRGAWLAFSVRCALHCCGESSGWRPKRVAQCNVLGSSDLLHARGLGVVLYCICCCTTS